MNRQMLIILLCCAIPLVIIFALPYLGIAFATSGWLLLILLLCPLMHLFMMCRYGDHHKPKGGGM